MLTERVEQRVLGALQLVDRVTQTPVKRFLTVTSNSASVIRNRRGVYVITHANGLEAHTEAFAAPPASPPIETNTYVFEVHDPQKCYLPRLVAIRLPRDPDPAHRANDNSLFVPRDVAMYPAANAAISHNWSTIRVSVSQQGNVAVTGALIKVFDLEDETVLGSGISDQNGEALVVIPGVPVTKFASEEDSSHGNSGGGGPGHNDDEPPVVVNTLPVRLELSFDTTAPWPGDPELSEQNHATNRRVNRDLVLSTGRMERVVITLT